MKVQRVQVTNESKVTWVVLEDNLLPVRPIQNFITHLENVERSPNTVRAYAHHLRLYWEFLQDTSREWTKVGKLDLSAFVEWLRKPNPKVVSLQGQTAQRRESTVNAILTSVGAFYEFQHDAGYAEMIPLYRYEYRPKKFKEYLYHINKDKPVKVKEIKLKEPKRIPKTLTTEQVSQLIEACQRLRDKFLIALLYSTGMRIGQALGLRHQDIKSWDNLIWIIPRNNNSNGARAKTKDAFSINVTENLMALYSDYVLEEVGEIESDYVFINLWEGRIGEPMSYPTVADLFSRLSQKTGFKAHPHQIRHTHGTELIRSGWEAAYVQKRLGHAHVQTTINTYVHLNDEDMKQAYKQYLEKREHHGPTTDPVV